MELRSRTARARRTRSGCVGARGGSRRGGIPSSRRRNPRGLASSFRGALAAALAALCFGLYTRGNLGTGEIPMALGWVFLAGAFLDTLEEEPGSLARLAAASFLCAAIKKEGAVLPVLLALWA